MIIPIILAGGSGTRLWPASRKSFPKQFSNIVGNRSLFQESIARLTGPQFAAPTIVTGIDLRFIVAEQLDQMAVEGADILLEPEARNTAPAILAAALRHEHTPDAILMVAPSDHQILDGDAFAQAVSAGASEAALGRIVTFGITPAGPETGYGYLELSQSPEAGESQLLKSFVEKPKRDTAVALIESGRHMWNAGIFMFRVSTIIETFERLAPQLVMPCRAALATGKTDLCFFRLGADAFGRCESISIDYAVMEVAEALHVVPVDCGWSDLGSWRAVHGTSERDEAGNALSGAAMQIGCANSLLRSDRESTRLVGLGLENIAAIATDDAILVANMDDSERVKDVVAELRMLNAPQAEQSRQNPRAWGHYDTLSSGPGFALRCLTVKPGGRLGLHSHQHRSEHWVVVQGTATATVGDSIKVLAENQSAHIPLGSPHQLENRGKVPLIVIEVQSGGYLADDDVTRYEDSLMRLPSAAA